MINKAFSGLVNGMNRCNLNANNLRGTLQWSASNEENVFTFNTEVFDLIGAQLGETKEGDPSLHAAWIKTQRGLPFDHPNSDELPGNANWFESINLMYGAFAVTAAAALRTSGSAIPGPVGEAMESCSTSTLETFHRHMKRAGGPVGTVDLELELDS